MVAESKKLRTPFGEPKRKPLQQLRGTPAPVNKVNANNNAALSQKPGGVQASQKKPPPEKKSFLSKISCCSKKKGAKKEVKKNDAKPSTSSKRSLSSLFYKKKKPAASSKSTKATPARQPNRPFGQKPASSTIHPPPTPIKKQPAPAAKAKPEDNKNGKKSPSKQDKKKATQKIGGGESPMKSDKELKTGIEESVKESIKVPKKKDAKNDALESGRQFQEVKIRTVKLENGMTQRMVTLTSIYPENESPPPKPTSDGIENPQKNEPSSYITLKRANSNERIPALPPAFEDHFLDSPEKPANSRSIHSSKCTISTEVLVEPPDHQPSNSTSYATTSTSTSYHDQALSTISKLRKHYHQLPNDEIAPLSQHHDLKGSAMRAGVALAAVQQNIQIMKILTGERLLPDLPMYSDEIAEVIRKVDGFIQATNNASERERAKASPKKRISRR